MYCFGLVPSQIGRCDAVKILLHGRSRQTDGLGRALDALPQAMMLDERAENVSS